MALIVITLFVQLPFMVFQNSINICQDWDYAYKSINSLMILLIFVKINQYLQIFESFCFLVQMIDSVFYDLRFFLCYYIMVMTTFAMIFNILFDQPVTDSAGFGSLSYLLMSLRTVWGEGSFDIEKTEFKIVAWISYILLMLVGNIVLLNFLIAVVNQSYEASMQKINI